MKLLIIDNYDSFTFNLKHMCEPYVEHVHVYRNDSVTMELVNKYDKIIISPGPGLPQDSGICLDVIKKFYKSKPILGVCLGAQAIAVIFGAKLFNLDQVMHGKKSMIRLLDKNTVIYKDICNNISVGRYHSWAIDLSSSSNLITTALDEFNVTMSFKHKKYPLTGIQYHPESILTESGQQILTNWLNH